MRDIWQAHVPTCARCCETVREGRARVEQTIAAITDMLSLVQASIADVQKLATVAEEVSNDLEVIRSIADQTDLLALNAVIEAARAGDFARAIREGCRVVIQEPRLWQLRYPC